MFWDEAKIRVIAGNGGSGKISFRHEKFAPRGGPDGGDGGNGGDIYFQADCNLNTLSNFVRLKQFKAENGRGGENKKKSGKSGADLVLKVPQGTCIYELSGIRKKRIFDLIKHNQKVQIARGGKGGFGNAHFARATHQAPRFAQEGHPGEQMMILLVLKLIADVGIIGKPNSGKSTLLAHLTSCRPKIADYPFTTLVPNLGVLKYKDKAYVLCDIPGLIENAYKGKGLGDKFLRHIERTKILVHLLDAGSDNLLRDWREIKQELKLFNPLLLRKKEILVVNKIDAFPFPKIPKKLPSPILISAVTGEGIEKLMQEISRQLK